MLKLSKIDFWMKEGVNARKTEEMSELELKYGIIVFHVKTKISKKAYKKRGYWVAEKGENGGEIYTHISTENVISYAKGKRGVYLIGTKGVFYKKNKKTPIECVLPGGCFEGCRLYPRINGLTLFFGEEEGDDVIYLFDSKDGQTESISNIEIVSIKPCTYWSREKIVSSEDETKLQITVKSNNEYYHYYFAENGIEHHQNIAFKCEGDVKAAQEGELVIGYNDDEKKYCVVSIEKGKLKIFSEFFDQLEKLESPEDNQEILYYLAKNTKIRSSSILRITKIAEQLEYKNLGIVPYGEYDFKENTKGVVDYNVKKGVNNVVYYTLRQGGKGAYLIAITPDTVTSKYYGNIEDIN